MDYTNLFYYKDGILFECETRSRMAVKDAPAGTLRSDGYIGIFVGKRYLFAHRLIWQMFKGPIPVGLFIDHIDNNRANNDILNLRLCTTQENAFNRGKQSNNKSGYKGVCWHKQKAKWVAQIKIDGRNKFLGFFVDPTEAYEKYCEVAIERYGDFCQL